MLNVEPVIELPRLGIILTNFFSLPHPYADCITISFKDSVSAGMGAQKLAARLNGQNLLIHTAPGNPNSVAVYSKSARFVTRNGCAYLFSGFGRISQKFVFGSYELAKFAGQPEIGEDVGQFTYFAINPDGDVIAETDLLGHGHLFSSQHDDFAMISNRLHLHTLVSQALGSRLELNSTVALSMLFSDHTFFSQQYMSHEMLSCGISVVPIDKRASLRDGVLTLRGKQVFEKTIASEPGNYAELVRCGVNEIIKNVSDIFESPFFGKIIVDLSGGKDSRLVLGSVLRQNGWSNRIALNTIDVPSSQDLPIACGIANHFGASFYAGTDIPQAPFSAEQNLNLWRSYFHGLYHRMGVATWTYEGRNTDTLCFSGGSGEILRTFWYSNLRRDVLPKDDIRTFANRLVKRIIKEPFAAPGNAGTISDHLVSVLEPLPGANLNEKLESHYLYFRNRAHFGLRGFSFYHDCATWFPLMSASLLKAAHSLPFEERAAGRLVRDAMRALAPVLLRFPFDGTKLEENESEIEINSDRSAWEAATAATAKRRIISRAGQKPTLNWAEFYGKVLENVIQAHEESKKLSAVYSEIVPDEYIDVFKKEIAVKSKKSMQMASSLFAIRDSIS